MLKSCAYCGRIHDSKVMCAPRARAMQDRQRKKGSAVDRFHSSARWTEKSLYIRRRDRYLCLACLYGLDGKGKRITTDALSVHHIVPIVEDWNERLNDANLVTLCAEHHQQAEDGLISRKKLLEAVRMSEDGAAVYPPGV